MQTLSSLRAARGNPLHPKMTELELAIYHLSVKTISRSAGRSATAAAAYRSGTKIRDERTGEVHDYRRRHGVIARTLLVPTAAPAAVRSRSAIWNAAEMAELRSNSTVAREYEVALPAELCRERQIALATELATHVVRTYGVAADVAVHAPSGEGDRRNTHAHILTSTRALGPDGFGAKTRILDAAKTGGVEISRIREHWAGLVNGALREAGVDQKVDHRSFQSRGLDVPATVHLGPALTVVERRRRREANARGEPYKAGSRRARLNAAIVAARRELREARDELAQVVAEGATRCAAEEHQLAEKLRQHQVAAQKEGSVPKAAEELQRADERGKNAAAEIMLAATRHVADQASQAPALPVPLSLDGAREIAARARPLVLTLAARSEHCKSRIGTELTRIEQERAHRTDSHDRNKPIEPKGFRALIPGSRVAYAQAMDAWERARLAIQSWRVARENTLRARLQTLRYGRQPTQLAGRVERAYPRWLEALRTIERHEEEVETIAARRAAELADAVAARVGRRSELSAETGQRDVPGQNAPKKPVLARSHPRKRDSGWER